METGLVDMRIIAPIGVHRQELSFGSARMDLKLVGTHPLAGVMNLFRRRGDGLAHRRCEYLYQEQEGERDSKGAQRAWKALDNKQK